MDTDDPITDIELADLCRNAALAFKLMVTAQAELQDARTKDTVLRHNAAAGAFDLAEARLFQVIRLLALERTAEGA